MSELSIIIPAYNEAENLGHFLPEWAQYASRSGYQLIIINDGSSDGTAAVLEKYRSNRSLRIIDHKVRRGYGGAIKSGIKRAETEFAVTFDADGQHQPPAIDQLIKAMKESGADMVIGQRSNLSEGGLYRSLGRNLIRWVAGLLLPVKIRDLNSGLKLFRVDPAKKYIRICPDSMAFSDVITLAFISQGDLVRETPIVINQRRGGDSKITTYTALETLWSIINITLLFKPMGVFLPLAVAFFILGFLWAIPFALQGRGVSVFAALLFLAGLFMFFFGMIAEQLSILIKSRLDE